MDVWRITVAAVRRWYVLVPLLALTVVLALAAGRGVKEEYEVTGAAMVVPGRSYSEIPNPYGGPSDANNAVAIVLDRKISYTSKNRPSPIAITTLRWTGPTGRSSRPDRRTEPDPRGGERCLR